MNSTKAYVLGIDLCGPVTTINTGIALFHQLGAKLRFVEEDCDGSDEDLLALVERIAEEGPLVIGVDAPLSYQPGGSDRARDKALRREVIARGLRSGSVMPPTLNRMAYLTLRGIVLARAIAALQTRHRVSIVEVHPGAAFCFRDAPFDAVREFGKAAVAQQALVKWLQPRCQFNSVPPMTSHFVAACGAAIAARDWAIGKSHWIARAEPPWHPYDFAC